MRKLGLYIVSLLIFTASNVQAELEKSICESKELYQNALEVVKKYTDELPTSSIIAKREKALLLANIEGFETVDAVTFVPEEDFNTANALITIKFNDKVSEEEFILCRQVGKREKPLYLLGYPRDGNFIFHLINLDQLNDDYNAFSFTLTNLE